VGPAGHSTGLRGGVGSTFSREQWIRLTLLGQRERSPHTGTAHRKRMIGVHGLVQEAYMTCVSGFPL
jgi:hypothetical protein